MRIVTKPLLDLWKQGMTPEAMALSIALGFALGVVPAPGCATLFCALAALALRLNLPAIQCVNYLVYPLQLTLLAPFLKMGAWLFRSSPAPPAGFVTGELLGAWHAVVAWLLVCAPAGALLYLFLVFALRRRGATEVRSLTPAPEQL